MKTEPIPADSPFAQFKDSMRKILSVPKRELDEQLRLHSKKKSAPRKGKAAGRKKTV